MALEPGGRRGGVRPYFYVGDWRGDGHVGVVLRIRLLRVPQRWRLFLQRRHQRVEYNQRHDDAVDVPRGLGVRPTDRRLAGQQGQGHGEDVPRRFVLQQQHRRVGNLLGYEYDGYVRIRRGVQPTDW